MKKLAGWKVERLRDVCEIDKIPNRKNNLPYVGLEHIESNTGKFIGSTQPQSVKSMSFNFSNKHVLYGRLRPYLKKVLLPDFEGHCSSEIFPLKVSEGLDRRFLFHWLLADETTEKINATSTGARMPRANMNQVLDFEILIPPLPEQQRIVSLLDQTFLSIAGAKVNAERNLVNARELFESLLNEYFGDARKGWKEMKLDDACIVERGSSPRPIKEYQTTSKDGVNWIKIGDTKGIEKYLYSTREKITKEGAKQSRFVKEGDFILTNSMSFGNPYIMKTEGYIHDGWFVLRLKEFIDTEFFLVFIGFSFVRNQFNQLASGAIVKNISGDLVKKAVLYIPPLAEQHTIVARLDVLSGETKKLEGIYQRKLESLEELKKSVLQRAFEGEI